MGASLQGLNKFKLDSFSSNIASIQRGSIQPFNDTVTTSVTILINPVRINNSVVKISSNDVSNGDTQAASIKLIDSTHIQITRYSAASAGFLTYYWEVIEFNNVKSKQCGLCSTGTVAISPVNLDKSMLFVSATKTTNYRNTGTYGIFNNSSQIILDSLNANVEWQVIEFN